MIEQQKLDDILIALKSGNHVLIFVENNVKEISEEIFKYFEPHTKHVLSSNEIILKNDTFLCIRKLININIFPKDISKIGYKIFFV